MQNSNCELKQNKRKHWIDLLRGFCMVAILLDHTEIYYTGDNIIGYNYYVANVLVAFFFLSGYLFYKDTPFSLQLKLKAIARYWKNVWKENNKQLMLQEKVLITTKFYLCMPITLWKKQFLPQ